jgi:hypothetical protein
VAAAPDSTRLQIFHEAENVRNVNMNDDKDLMELTIPVFYALIAADVDNKYYRNHGSLGWALKDKRPPDWREADTELAKAIAIRSRLGITGWRLYEVGRAVCNINIFNDPQPGDPTLAEISASVDRDLKAAQDDPNVKLMIDPESPTVDPDIKQWILQHPTRQATPDFLCNAAVKMTVSE